MCANNCAAAPGVYFLCGGVFRTEARKTRAVFIFIWFTDLVATVLQEAARAASKAEKIKMALEKMKEASIKKVNMLADLSPSHTPPPQLYVKFFTADGNFKMVMVDERSTCSYVLRQLAEKHRIALTLNHAIVEHHPELYMRMLL